MRSDAEKDRDIAKARDALMKLARLSVDFVNFDSTSLSVTKEKFQGYQTRLSALRQQVSNANFEEEGLSKNNDDLWGIVENIIALDNEVKKNRRKTNNEEIYSNIDIDVDVSMFYKKNPVGESKGNVSPSSGSETEEFDSDADVSQSYSDDLLHIRVFKDSLENDSEDNEKFKHRNSERGTGFFAAMKGYSNNFVSIDRPPELKEVQVLTDGQKSRPLNELDNSITIKTNIYSLSADLREINAPLAAITQLKAQLFSDTKSENKIKAIVDTENPNNETTLLDRLNKMGRSKLFHLPEVYEQVCQVKKSAIKMLEQMNVVNPRDSNVMGNSASRMTLDGLESDFKNSLEKLESKLVEVRDGKCKNKVPPTLLEVLGMDSVQNSIAQRVKRVDTRLGIVQKELNNIFASGDSRSESKSQNNDLRDKILNYFQEEPGNDESMRRAQDFEMARDFQDDNLTAALANKFLVQEYREGGNDIYDFMYDANEEIFQSLCQEFFTDDERSNLNIEAFKQAGLLSELKTIQNHPKGLKAGAVEFMKRASSYLTTASSTSIAKQVCGNSKTVASQNIIMEDMDAQYTKAESQTNFVEKSLDVNIANKQRKVRGLKQQHSFFKDQLNFCSKYLECQQTGSEELLARLDLLKQDEMINSFSSGLQGLDNDGIKQMVRVLSDQCTSLDDQMQSINSTLSAPIAGPGDSKVSAAEVAASNIDDSQGANPGWIKKGRSHAETLPEKKIEQAEEKVFKGPSR